MFQFFKKKQIVSDISWLGVDIHSHILPGIDDGSTNIEQSMRYIKTLTELGFKKLFFTPHVFTELYPNNEGTISEALSKVTSISGAEQYNLDAAAEYMVDYNFTVEKGLMTLPNNHLLIEMSYLSETPNIEEVIFNLQVLGYKIILAHPERYNFYHKNLDRYTRLREMGCLFQLNLLSVIGYYGKSVKQASTYLLSNKMYDLAGTDLHHDKHLGLLTECVKNGVLYSNIGSYNFKNLELFG